MKTITTIIDPKYDSFRKKLETITNKPSGKQPEAIAQLSKYIPHSIRLIQMNVQDERLGSSNCHEYTLGLLHSKIVDFILKHDYWNIYLADDFMSWVIDNKLDEIDTALWLPAK